MSDVALNKLFRKKFAKIVCFLEKRNIKIYGKKIFSFLLISIVKIIINKRVSTLIGTV